MFIHVPFFWHAMTANPRGAFKKLLQKTLCLHICSRQELILLPHRLSIEFCRAFEFPYPAMLIWSSTPLRLHVINGASTHCLPASKHSKKHWRSKNNWPQPTSKVLPVAPWWQLLLELANYILLDSTWHNIIESTCVMVWTQFDLIPIPSIYIIIYTVYKDFVYLNNGSNIIKPWAKALLNHCCVYCNSAKPWGQDVQWAAEFFEPFHHIPQGWGQRGELRLTNGKYHAIQCTSALTAWNYCNFLRPALVLNMISLPNPCEDVRVKSNVLRSLWLRKEEIEGSCGADQSVITMNIVDISGIPLGFHLQSMVLDGFGQITCPSEFATPSHHRNRQKSGIMEDQTINLMDSVNNEAVPGNLATQLHFAIGQKDAASFARKHGSACLKNAGSPLKLAGSAPTMGGKTIKFKR